MRRLALFFFLLLSCCTLKAQFSLNGSDPGKTRWMSVDSPGFRIIYPVGEDSLARVYGSWLEKAKVAVSWSSGMRIGEYYDRRMPVILHSFKPISNASVAWAPKRMDIYTTLDPFSPTPIRWEKLLAFHEGRHAAQMQAGAGGRYKILGRLTGELFAGAVAGIYPGPTLLEGDAVVTETALTESGRGRQGSFLSYLAPAFDCEDWRDYWRMSLGSEKYYTPDHYRAGYMLISGMRVFFDDPSFTDEYFSRVRKGGFFLLPKTVKAVSGTGLRRTFGLIENAYEALWSEEALGRGPFMPAAQVSAKPWRHVAYSGSVIDSDGVIWTKKSGLTEPRSLTASTSSGKEKKARAFASYTSNLSYDKANGRILWSEAISDSRWDLGGSSRIRYVQTESPSRVHDLSKEGKYFNPAASPDGALVCAVEYSLAGGSRIVLLNSSDGTVGSIIEAPDSLQFTEPAWIGSRLFAAGLSDHGMGLYEVSSKGVVKILGPQPVELSSLNTAPETVEGPALTFVCDRTGVNEMYLLEVDSGRLTQVTSTRYGITSPVFNVAADTLFYSSLAPSDHPEAYRQGWVIYSTPAKDLPMREVSFDDVHKYPVAEKLSEQERVLAGQGWEDILEYSETSFSEPRRRRKLTPTIHSWTPLYFNYDNVENTSGDEYFRTSSLGATVMFQNLIGDGYGFVGYSLHEDSDLRENWRHSGHVKYVYSGLLPVLEFSADFGDRSAKEICRVQLDDQVKKAVSVFSETNRTGKPYFEGSLRAYVPLNLSSGGISRGLIPQVRLRMTNDLLNDKISLRSLKEEGREAEETGFLGEDHVSTLSTVDLSVRGYILRERAASQTYPRLGIGAEVGVRSRPGHSGSLGNAAYFYTYGYLPGILQNQGIRLSATFGKSFGGGKYSYTDNPVSFAPRGFAGSTVKTVLNSCAPEKLKITFDYYAPILNLDWSGLSPLVYVKNVALAPFFDLATFNLNQFSDFHINKNNVASETLISAGVDVVAKLGNLLWLPFNSQAGIRCAYNSWTAIDRLNVKGLDKYYIGLLFDVSL